MGHESRPTRKAIDHCVYCSNPPNAKEHWLNRSLGKFAHNTTLTGRICTECNEYLGRTIDGELVRTGHTGVLRQVLGIKGRSTHERKNVFEYKASHLEPPVQSFRPGENGELTPVFEQPIRRELDGTLVGTLGRVLVIASAEGEQHLRFPRGWGAEQLRAAANARGLLAGRPVAAHVAPPETIEEFVAASHETIRAVFGPFEINVQCSRPDAAVDAIEPRMLRFNLSPEYARAVAKTGFHYFLWACPSIGGDEPEFSAIKAYIRHGVGDASAFLSNTDSLVDRTEPEKGPAQDCHAFAALCRGEDVIVQVHFFSQPVGPAFPTFIVRLGTRPGPLSASWRRVHVAAYSAGIEGHDGVLNELLLD